MTFSEYQKRIADLQKEQSELSENFAAFKQTALEVYYRRKDEINNRCQRELRAAAAEYEEQLRQHKLYRMERNSEIELQRQFLARQFKAQEGGAL